MQGQLLWIEVLMKLGSGLALLLAPGTVIRLLGLPSVPDGFWPRLLGSVLVGMGLASFLSGQVPGSSGLGLGGSVAINLTSAAMLGAFLALAGAKLARRGRIVIWLTVVLLAALGLIEIAWA